MQKTASLSLLLTISLSLAACSAPSAEQPTNAPTAAATNPGLAVPTEAPAGGQPDAGASELGSGSWRWVQAIDAAGVQSPITDTSRFAIQFDPAAGTVSIGTACRSATGAYVTNGHALTIRLESTTRAVCPGDVLSSQFLVELSSVTAYTLDGGQLVLQLGGAGGMLRLAH